MNQNKRQVLKKDVAQDNNQSRDPVPWDRALLDRFSSEELLKCASCMNGIQVPEHIREFVAQYPPTMADRQFAVQLSKGKSTAGKQYIHSDAVNMQGGSTLHSEGRVCQTGVGIRAHTIIPSPPKSVDRYPSQQRMSVLFSQMITVEKGEIQVINMTVFGKVFPTLNMMNCQLTANLVVEDLTRHSLWTSKTSMQRLSTTGIHLPLLLHEYFSACAPDVYYRYVNNFIVFASGTYALEDGVLVETPQVVQQKSFPPVADDVYNSLKAPKKIEEETKAGDIFESVAGIRPEVVIPPITDSKSLSRATALAMSFGGSTSVVSLLNGMRGYGSFMSDMGKRVTFLISVALAQLIKNEKVAIRVASVGDIPLLISSLNQSLQRWWVMHGKQSIPDGHLQNLLEIIVPSPDDLFKVSAVYNHFCRTQWTSGIYICWKEVSFPSADTKGASIDYEMLATKIIAPDGPPRYICSTRLWGSQWWAQPAHGESTSKYRKRDCHVYQYGDTSEAAIVSSEPDLFLGGWTVSASFKEYTYSPQPLVVVKSERDWYQVVTKGIGWRFLFWLDPRVFNSPIANVLSQTSKAAQVAKGSRFEEDIGLEPQSYTNVAALTTTGAKKIPTRAERKQVKPSEFDFTKSPASVSSTTTTTTTTTTASVPAHSASIPAQKVVLKDDDPGESKVSSKPQKARVKGGHSKGGQAAIISRKHEEELIKAQQEEILRAQIASLAPPEEEEEEVPVPQIFDDTDL